jgi:hypothetical protein
MGRLILKRQNLTSLLKVGGGRTVNNPSSVYVFKGGSINTLANIFNPINFQVNDTIFITSLELFLNDDYDFLFQVDDHGVGKYWRNEQTNMNNYVIPVNYIIYFNTSNNNNIQVSNGAIIQKYNQGKISIKSNRSYQKLAQTDGTSSNIGNFNDIALDYSDFAKNCSTLGLDPTTMLNNLGGVDFSNNFVVMRARRGNRFPNERISDLGNGVMNINSTGPSFGFLSNWYKFFVMSKKGWNTVILFGTNYSINGSLGKLTAE